MLLQEPGCSRTKGLRTFRGINAEQANLVPRAGSILNDEGIAIADTNHLALQQIGKCRAYS